MRISVIAECGHRVSTDVPDTFSEHMVESIAETLRRIECEQCAEARQREQAASQAEFRRLRRLRPR